MKTINAPHGALGLTSGTVTIPLTPQIPQPSLPCPHCGHCPHCGRGGVGVSPSFPQPYYPTWPNTGGPIWWVSPYEALC